MAADQPIDWDVDMQDQDQQYANRHGRRERVPGRGNHAAPEGADIDPLIDLSRDPNPGVPNHAAPDED
jgi:hypothetical protein